jgi:hypothetical protein
VQCTQFSLANQVKLKAIYIYEAFSTVFTYTYFKIQNPKPLPNDVPMEGGLGASSNFHSGYRIYSVATDCCIDVEVPV